MRSPSAGASALDDQIDPSRIAVAGYSDGGIAALAAAFDRRVRGDLLWLLGASHLPPYARAEPELALVERASTAFFDHYLKGRPLRAFERAARRRGLTRLVAAP